MTVLTAVAVIVGVVVLLLSGGGPSDPPPVQVATGPDAAVDAHAACVDMLAVQSLVRSDAAKDRVFDYLTAATGNINAAAQANRKWLSLQSGIGAVAEGLRTNDGNAATLGIAIVRDQCRLTGVSLAHFPQS